MKLFSKGKDGGPESKVTGYWLIEAKSLFSLALLRFDNGSREAYHSHAFNSLSLVLGPGHLHEYHLNGGVEMLTPGRFIVTRRETFHKVVSVGRTWVLTVRGPWSKTWLERTDNVYVLTHGRRVVGKETN